MAQRAAPDDRWKIPAEHPGPCPAVGDDSFEGVPLRPLGIADSDGGGYLRGVADEPRSRVVVRGAGLAGGWPPDRRRVRVSRALGDHSGEDARHRVGDTGGHRPLAAGCGGNVHVLLAGVGGRQDITRVTVDAVGGKRGIGVGHVQRGDTLGANGYLPLCGGDFLQVGSRDPEPGRHADDGRYGDFLRELDVVGVHRVPGCLRHVVDAAFLRFGVGEAGGTVTAAAWIPPGEPLGDVACGRIKLGVEPVPRLQRGGEREGLERGAGLEHRRGRQRFLGLIGRGVGAEGPVHRHRQDVAGARFDHHLGG